MRTVKFRSSYKSQGRESSFWSVLEREINRARARFILFLPERAPAKENHRKTEESSPLRFPAPFYALRRETVSVPGRGLFKLGTNATGIYGPLTDLRPYLFDDAVGLANVVFDDPLPSVTPSGINPR